MSDDEVKELKAQWDRQHVGPKEQTTWEILIDRRSRPFHIIYGVGAVAVLAIVLAAMLGAFRQ